jgi:hypothetical protein
MYAAAALAAAATVARAALARQRVWRGLAGSSRCAAEDSQAEIFGATLCSRTWPVRSTRGAAQVRVLRALIFAAAPALRAGGLTWAATCLS